jgi:hypothetical protein
MFNTETMLSYELANCVRSGPESNLLTDRSMEYESQGISRSRMLRGTGYVHHSEDRSILIGLPPRFGSGLAIRKLPFKL